MNMMKTTRTILMAGVLALGVFSVGTATAAQYKIDRSHSTIEFAVSHFGYGVVKGRFNEFSGEFGDDSTKIEIDMESVDSNWAARDKHLRSGDFFNVADFPKATFVSTGMVMDGENIILTGDLTIRDVTKSIEIAVTKIGEGKDRGGNVVAGFKGEFTINRSDYNVSMNLGPLVEQVTITMYLDGAQM